MVGAVAVNSDLTPTVHLGAVNRRSGVEMVYAIHSHVLQ